MIAWTPSLSTGNEVLDEQHKAIFRWLAELDSAASDERTLFGAYAMTRLKNYTRSHFAAEEALMKASGYPGLADHIAEHESFRARHARWFADFASMHGLSTAQVRSLATRWPLVLEHDNLRAALDWAAAHDGALGLSMAAALLPFWRERGHHAEAQARCEALLAHPANQQPSEARARVSIVLCRHTETGAGASRWLIRLDASARPDITVAVRMDATNEGISTGSIIWPMLPSAAMMTMVR